VISHLGKRGRPFYLYILNFNCTADIPAEKYPKQKRRNRKVTPFGLSGAEGRNCKINSDNKYLIKSKLF
jgi:hypothetical protein